MSHNNTKHFSKYHRSRRYMSGLDGLRAISVLAVIAYHLNIKYFQGGLLGVGIFFVISGYLITDQIITEWQRQDSFNLLHFWKRRVKRLIPAVIWMLFCVSIWLLIFDFERLQSLKGAFFSSIFYVNNWWLIFHKVSYFENFGPPSPIGHLWSLSIEEQFYLIWPVILMVGLKKGKDRSKLTIWVLFAAILSALWMAWVYVPGTDPSRVYYGTDTRAFGLLIGVSLAFVWPSQKLSYQVSKQARYLLDFAGGTCLLLIILMIVNWNKYDIFLYRGGFVLLSVVTTILIAALAHPASSIGKWLSWKPLRWIGVRSYSLYLWHFPVIILSSTSNIEHTSIFHITVQVALSFILAAISYKYIEEPFRRGTFKKMERSSLLHKSILRRIYLGTILLIVFFLIIFKGYLTFFEKKPLAAEVIMGQIQENGDANKKTEKIDEGNKQAGKRITVIGDSVILDAAPYLKEMIPGIVIDGKVGRQMVQAQHVIDNLQLEGKLGETVVIELGTNGSFHSNQLRNVLESLQDKKRVFIVNTRVPRDWQDIVNRNITEIANEFANTTLIDWYSASEGKEDYFYEDGVHLSATGAKIYASIIANRIKEQ
ncbi:acetyltransferase [Niallia circulans]|uniref:acyltransferase family protein n=1 Tax=Niallia circulans TaxID=1397 RepID=UPI000F447075|nr:acyltransferase family protein [Niallia circulans]AYV69990.1 acetyltransferase [Niallia circulans]